MDPRPRFLDIHIIQPVPYANLNRDDTNSVKTMLYGDALRTRISSQSWKRAVREHFQNELGDNALRTRRIGERVAEVLRGRGWDQALAERAGAHVAAGSSIKWEVAKGKDKQPITNKVLTNALVYLPEDAVEELADIAEAHKDSLTTDFTGKGKSKPESALKGKIDKVLLRRNGVINLFGRMLAEVDQAGVDGAVQVAHAFTTHATEVELDYFAAVDDVTATRDDETGSGHMRTAELSTGTLYRFATIDLQELTKNLSDDNDTAVGAARGPFALAALADLGVSGSSAAARTDAALALLAALEDFMVHLQEINAPTEGVYCAVTPRAFQDIRALGVARDADDLAGGTGRPYFGGVAEAGGLGAQLTQGMNNLSDSLEYMGVRIVKTTHLPQTDASVDVNQVGEARYNLDCSDATTGAGVRAIIWQSGAVASLSKLGLKVDTVDDIRRNTTFTVASMLAGTGVLKPECCALVTGKVAATRAALATAVTSFVPELTGAGAIVTNTE